MATKIYIYFTLFINIIRLPPCYSVFIIGSQRLPRATDAFNVAYDAHNDTILLIGGYPASRYRQLVLFKNHDFIFDSQYYLSLDQQTSSFGQGYTVHRNHVWSTKYFGEEYVKFNIKTYDAEVPTVTIPNQVSNANCLTSMDGYLFHFGGIYGGSVSSFQIYRFNDSQWLSNVLSPQELRDNAACVVVDYKIYLIGGKTSYTQPSQRTDTIEVFDVSNIETELSSTTWNYFGDSLTGAARDELRATVHGTIIYAVGGATDDYAVADVTIIDTVAAQCTAGDSLSYPIAGAACIVVGNVLYVFGGFIPPGNPENRENRYQYWALPTTQQSVSPTNHLTKRPTYHPTGAPIVEPTYKPSASPIYSLTKDPTSNPSNGPTNVPSSVPSTAPSPTPISVVTTNPSFMILDTSHEPTMMQTRGMQTLQTQGTITVSTTMFMWNAPSNNNIVYYIVIPLVSAFVLFGLVCIVMQCQHKTKTKETDEIGIKMSSLSVDDQVNLCQVHSGDRAVNIDVSEKAKEQSSSHTEGNHGTGALEVEQWLTAVVQLPQYLECFVNNGYDRLLFIKDISQTSDLEDIGICVLGHQTRIFAKIKLLKALIDTESVTVGPSHEPVKHEDVKVMQGQEGRLQDVAQPPEPMTEPDATTPQTDGEVIHLQDEDEDVDAIFIDLNENVQTLV
eukprot:237900_1